MLYGASILAVSIHSLLFLLFIEDLNISLFLILFAPTILLVFACLRYSFGVLKDGRFPLTSQLWTLLVLFGLVDVSISIWNIAVVGLATTAGLLWFLAMLPFMSLIFLGSTLRTFDRSGNSQSVKLAFSTFILSNLIGRPGITIGLYLPNVSALTSGNAIWPTIDPSVVGNAVQFILTFSVLIPVYLFIQLRTSQVKELKKTYIAIAGFAYVLTFFIPRGFDLLYGLVFYVPYSNQGLVSLVEIMERLADFLQGVLLAVVFGGISSLRFADDLIKEVKMR